MSVQPLPVSQPVDFGRWPRRLALSIAFFLGACLVWLPYSFHALVDKGARPFLWGGIALGLLAAALLARRSPRLQAYWLVLYALFAASAAAFADWFLSELRTNNPADCSTKTRVYFRPGVLAAYPGNAAHPIMESS